MDEDATLHQATAQVVQGGSDNADSDNNYEDSYVAVAAEEDSNDAAGSSDNAVVVQRCNTRVRYCDLACEHKEFRGAAALRYLLHHHLWL